MTRDELLDRVPRLTDTFRLIRSKDAGPFMLTIDLFCHDADGFRRVPCSPFTVRRRWSSDEASSCTRSLQRLGRPSRWRHRGSARLTPGCRNG